MSTVIETEDCDNIEIPSYVTFMTNRCKLTNTPSDGISVASRNNIFFKYKNNEHRLKFVTWFKLQTRCN